MSLPFGGKHQPNLQKLFNLSGTSIAAPVVSGAVALMLQANPGLTPPLIKAMLQYSAQPLSGANLLQQGAGLLNVDGAMQLASALRSDLAALKAGDTMLVKGKKMPKPVSVLNGQTIAWSQLIFAGGSHVLTGSALLSKYQPFFDPTLVWVNGVAAPHHDGQLAGSHWRSWRQQCSDGLHRRAGRQPGCCHA